MPCNPGSSMLGPHVGDLALLRCQGPSSSVGDSQQLQGGGRNAGFSPTRAVSCPCGDSSVSARAGTRAGCVPHGVPPENVCGVRFIKERYLLLLGLLFAGLLSGFQACPPSRPRTWRLSVSVFCWSHTHTLSVHARSPLVLAAVWGYSSSAAWDCSGVCGLCSSLTRWGWS